MASLLLKKNAALTGLLLITLLQWSTAQWGMETFPPSPLTDSMQQVVGSLIHAYSDSSCGAMPGSFYDGNQCNNPALRYAYSPPDSSGAAVFETDSAFYANQYIAFAAWYKFQSPRTAPLKRYAMDHVRFLQILQKKETPQKVSFWIRWLKTIIDWFTINVLQPLKELISPEWEKIRSLFSQLNTPSKIVVIVLFALLIMAATVILAHFAARMYPSSTYQLSEYALQSKAFDDWLKNARQLAHEGKSQEAIESLYRWFIDHSHKRHMVRRYEWWTNNQLVKVITRKYPKHAPFVKELISRYEETSYGHRSLPPVVLDRLLHEAERKGMG